MFKKRLFAGIFLCIVSLTAIAEEMTSPPFHNLSIVVTSCDKYAEVWPSFFTFLFKEWPSLKTTNQNIPIILITNEKTYLDPRVTILQTGPDKSWSLNMLKALQIVKTEYVLYLQEDYILNKPVRENRLHEILKVMQEENASYVQIGLDGYMADYPLHSKWPGIGIKERFHPFRTSLQVSLWKTADFIWLLNPTENPWDFEVIGSTRSQGMRTPFFAVVKETPIEYLNACDKGYWNHQVLEYLKAQGMTHIPQKLPVDKDHKFSLWWQDKRDTFLAWLKEKHPNTYKRVMRLREKFHF